MKRLAAEHPSVVRVPVVVGVAPIAVEPPAVRVVFDVEDVRITVGIHLCEKRHPATVP